MTRVVCGSCGAAYALSSDFELDGECRECGEEALIADDAYDAAPELLVCVVCRRELAGGPVTRQGDEWYEGRYTVDDPCPLCGGELVPRAWAPPLRSRPELGLARRVAQKASPRSRRKMERGATRPPSPSRRGSRSSAAHSSIRGG